MEIIALVKNKMIVFQVVAQLDVTRKIERSQCQPEKDKTEQTGQTPDAIYRSLSRKNDEDRNLLFVSSRATSI